MRLIQFLFITNFFTGALVMIIELLGTRFMSPFFGSSLYVWTSLITVTLISLSAGHGLGGYVADKFPTPTPLYTIIFSAGVVLLGILLIRNPILHICVNFGSRAGSLASATLLFGPPLFLMGMVSPYSVKLCTHNMDKLGNTVGWLYATSTFGSFVGTITAGFLLLPNFSNIAVLVVCATSLSLLASIYFLFFKKKALHSAVTLFLIGVAGLVAYRSTQLPRGILPAYGVEKKPVVWTVVYQTNSFYGRCRVIDLIQSKQRVLLNDGLTQGRCYINDTFEPAVSFPYALVDLLLSHKKKPENALILGLGAGFVPRIMMEKIDGIKITSIEINPKMINIAKDFFGLPPFNEDNEDFKIIAKDARVWIKDCKEKFDVIVLDTFLGDNTPSHLLSFEMFQDIERVLAEDGALSINIFGSLQGRRAETIKAVVKTMKSAPEDDNNAPGNDKSTRNPLFPNVHLFSYEATTTAHNIYMLAYRGEPKQQRNGLQNFFADPRNQWINWADKSLINQTAQLGDLAGSPVLRDRYNTAEYLDLPVKESLRKSLREFWGDILTE